MTEGLRDLAVGALSTVARASEQVGARFLDGARVARFLRGSLEFRTRAEDIFISSYPRSGTTWLQQVLLVLARNGDPGFEHISDEVPWFERSLALGTRRARSFETHANPRIFKSHLPLRWLPRGARYVYAVRDGRDVAVSYYHLYRSHLRYSGDFESFFHRFVRGDLQYKSWFKHTAGWRAAASRSDVFMVEYERMQADLPRVMSDLNRFLAFGHSPARVAELAPLCTFEYMKEREHRYDHATEERGLRGMRTGYFLRRGLTGDSSDYLSADQQRTFESTMRASHQRPGIELNLAAFLH